jgi:single-stranded-DNA-specific exonuclease
VSHPPVQYIARPRPALGSAPRTLLEWLVVARDPHAAQTGQIVQQGLSALPSPFLLRGMQEASVLLAQAIAQGRPITIVGDFDCDGATSTAVMVRGLRMLGATQVDFLVPSRFRGGYGLQPLHIDALRDRVPNGDLNGHVLITVDNGVVAFDGVAAARAAGMQVVVTDHHLPGDGPLPDAHALVNPNVPGGTYPSRSLAGVGVAWMLLGAVRARLRERGAFSNGQEPDLRTLLDIVAVGTVADVVPLDWVNRILVDAGLRRIRAGQACPGLSALFSCAGRDPAQASCDDIGFAIGPRINAAGRLSDMDVGIACLLADDAERAASLANTLHVINAERRNIEASVREQAQRALDRLALDDAPVIVLSGIDWHEGILGLLAGRIKETHYRPVFVFARGSDGTFKGSGRSIDGVHLRDALCAVAAREPGLLVRFGGHAMAAGCTLCAQENSVERFRAAINAVVLHSITQDALQRRVVTDGPFPWDFWSVQEWLPVARAVWGAGFPAPLFDNRFLVSGQRAIGKDGGHWAARVTPLAEDGTPQAHLASIRMVYFGRSSPLPEVARLIWRPSINTYRGETSLEMQVQDVVPD